MILAGWAGIGVCFDAVEMFGIAFDIILDHLFLVHARLFKALDK